MRILFLGDVVGPPGLERIRQALPGVITTESLDLVIANGENAANGSGITPRQYRQLRAAGVDAVTLGDHIYRRMEILAALENEDRICKPANFPPAAPGRDFILVPARDGTPVGVVSLLGRTFMRPVDCPFLAADRVLAEVSAHAKCIVVDVHAEATADKYLLGHHLKGRVSAVLGTHTHVPTADEHIMAGGTAYITDVGMCGPHDSILGRRIDRVLPTTIDFIPSMFEVASGDVRLNGVILDVDPATGRAESIRRYCFTEAASANVTSPATTPQIAPGATRPGP
jgi:metallophosphoesterase (TIGR00282 family)